MIFHTVTFINDENGVLYRGVVPIEPDLYTNVEWALGECNGAIDFSIGEMDELMRCHKAPRLRYGSHYVFVRDCIISALTMTRFDKTYSRLDIVHRRKVSKTLQETIANYIIDDPIKRQKADPDLVPPIIAQIKAIQKHLGLSDVTMWYIASDVLDIDGPVRYDYDKLLLADANKLLDFMEVIASK